VPCDEDGNEELEEDELPEDPSEMLNQPLNFKVKIERITGLPEDFCTNIYCEYKFYMDEEVHKTQVCLGKNVSPEIGYEKIHRVHCVTDFLLKYLQEDKMTIKIYGN
jgi:hypothetical protein